MEISQCLNPFFGTRETENGKRAGKAAYLFNYSTIHLFNYSTENSQIPTPKSA